MIITAWIIGIGSGDPDQLSRAAVTALNTVEVFLVADKGAAPQDLSRLRAELCHTVIDHDRYRVLEVADPPRDRRADLTDSAYDAAVSAWHAARVQCYRELIMAELPDGGDVGFLVWGDPSLYDSTIRIAESLAQPGFEVELQVLPGVSSPQLLAAAHRIVLNRVGRAVHITTGRRLAAELDPGYDTVVMLDSDLACGDLLPRHPDLEIFWGAQLGLPDETLVAGRLAEVIERITAERHRIRESRGWVFDTYLLRFPDALSGSDPTNPDFFFVA